MASQQGIYNLALGLLGAEAIASTASGSTEEIACDNNWSNSLDATLAAMPWSFASKRVELSQDSETPAFGWSYQYPLPADCVEPRVINEDFDLKWIVEGRDILIDEGEVNLVYTYRVANTGLFPSLFIDALAARLAADIAPAVTRDWTMQQKMMQLFDFRITAAQDIDASRGSAEQRDDTDVDNFSWITARD